MRRLQGVVYFYSSNGQLQAYVSFFFLPKTLLILLHAWPESELPAHLTTTKYMARYFEGMFRHSDPPNIYAISDPNSTTYKQTHFKIHQSRAMQPRQTLEEYMPLQFCIRMSRQTQMCNPQISLEVDMRDNSRMAVPLFPLAPFRFHTIRPSPTSLFHLGTFSGLVEWLFEPLPFQFDLPGNLQTPNVNPPRLLLSLLLHPPGS